MDIAYVSRSSSAVPPRGPHRPPGQRREDQECDCRDDPCATTGQPRPGALDTSGPSVDMVGKVLVHVFVPFVLLRARGGPKPGDR